jgi:HAD superfamily hydrolase (TIGR01490 family)
MVVSGPGAGTIAFFDLDRTLVEENTGKLYVRWRFQEGKMTLREVAHTSLWILQYTFGVLDAERVSQAAAESIAGQREDEFGAELAGWVEEVVLPCITTAARREVERCRREGFRVALLTSGSRYVADPVAADVGVDDVLCTRFEVEDGRFTGRTLPPVCYGAGKVEQATAFAEAEGLDLGRSRFYTDSVSDLPMLEAVAEPRVVNPDPRLTRLARRHRWPVAYWR